MPMKDAAKAIKAVEDSSVRYRTILVSRGGNGDEDTADGCRCRTSSPSSKNSLVVPGTVFVVVFVFVFSRQDAVFDPVHVARPRTPDHHTSGSASMPRDRARRIKHNKGRGLGVRRPSVSASCTGTTMGQGQPLTGHKSHAAVSHARACADSRGYTVGSCCTAVSSLYVPRFRIVRWVLGAVCRYLPDVQANPRLIGLRYQHRSVASCLPNDH
jgi:hypothetical protein